MRQSRQTLPSLGVWLGISQNLRVVKRTGWATGWL